jgi:AGCS family alanine or glycine:cation symporter
MKEKILKGMSLLMVLVSPVVAFAQEAGVKTMSQRIDALFQPIVDAMAKVIFFKPFAFIGLDLPLVVIWLVVGAMYFTIKMGFINVKGIKHAFQLVRGVFDKPGDEGEVSHFQALVTALSATVGLGNIAGVAVAVTLGGPGATFWMILAGFLGMSSKFVECTLGVKYRKINDKGEVSGGPMYYLHEGLDKLGKGGLGRVLAIMFAVLCIGGSFGGGNMFQANQAFAQLSGVPEFSFLADYGFVFGLIMAAAVGVVIIGGIKSIARVTDKIVPFMVGMYVIAALIIIGINYDQIGNAFSLIFEGAFNPDAAKGGIIGVLIVGFQRAAFSNEAGVGSASIAHAATKTDEPVSEGIVALLEPFIDTVVVCTMTALVIIFTGYHTPNSEVFKDNIVQEYNIDAPYFDKEHTSVADFAAKNSNYLDYSNVVLLNADKGVEIFNVEEGVVLDENIKPDVKIDGARLTSISFSKVFPWFSYVLLVAILMFAFSTMISWSYYGLKAWTFLFGQSRRQEYIYKGLFLVFTVIGASSSLGAVLDFSDMMILGMAFPNILGLYFLAKEVKFDLKSYLSRIKSGEIKRYK